VKQARVSVKEIFSSQAYQAHATDHSKAHIAVAILAAILTTTLGTADLGPALVWVTPVLVFGSSLLIAAPSMFVVVWLAAIQSGHTNYDHTTMAQPLPADALGRILIRVKNLWVIGSIALTAYATYRFVSWIGH
jgi:hypothetical protein